MQNDSILDRYNPATVSDINLESPNCAGDIAIRGYAIHKLYDDFVFANYVDVDNGFIKHESGLVTVDSGANKTWRKAKVIKVGPACLNTKPGDIILFPNDKGLPCGAVEFIEDNIIHQVKNGIFLSEHRIFATLKLTDVTVNN